MTDSTMQRGPASGVSAASLAPDAGDAPCLTDTHAHLASRRLRDRAADLVANAAAAGVGRIVSISCDLEDAAENLDFARRFASVSPVAGVHPLYVHEPDPRPGADPSAWLASLETVAAEPEVVAVGEIGLDYYHPPQDGSEETEWRRRQREAFEAQLDLARRLGLPAVVHQRESASDVAAVLSAFPGVRAVLHCFSGTREEAEAFLEMGHVLSFTGNLTYPSAAPLREVAAALPPDRVMVETDCPYLAPVPHRGKTCEPAMVVHTAAVLAELLGLEAEEFSERTTRTASSFFARRPTQEGSISPPAPAHGPV